MQGTRRAPRGVPTPTPRTCRVGSRPPATDDPPAGFPRGFDEPPTRSIAARARRRSGPVPAPLGAGRGRRRTASPPGQRPVGCMRGLAPGGRRPRAGDRMGPLLSDNSVDWSRKQATKQDVVVAQFLHECGPLRIACHRAGRRRGRGVIVTQTGRRRVARRLAAGRSGTDPRRIGSIAGRALGPGARRPDRRGQAPKGTGGMPRRHQDSGVEGCDKSGGAAERASSPECPSRPGELKHLSTRRKRNQPRLPQ